ncbi:MAG: neuraminidase-like domain-containing protein, partial [Snowella sp.]
QSSVFSTSIFLFAELIFFIILWDHLFYGFLLNNFPVIAIAEPTLFEEWQQLADYVLLRDSLPPGVSNLIDVFKAEDDQKSDHLANLTNWRKEEIENAIAELGYQNSDLSSIPHLLKIQQIIALSKKIGVSIDKLQNWAIAAPNSEQAKEIKNAVKAKYNEAAWLEISKPLSDKLREKQKSALIAYVLSMPQIRAANVTDSNRLFEYFLIDVEMCACMNTSRIKQGISSVQLFVQRCLLNLEPAVSPRAIDSDRWQWTKNYRVWEANRKVFLYPENWIEPELRDDKSPFFKELESELLQTDVTNEAAEKALLNYLYKLDQVARLEVCGMYLQEETDGQDKSILHVFARTMGGAVRSYFYRRLLNNKEWTPWEKVELDINGVQGSDKTEEDGIHLLPVVWNRRLYLFWLVFTQKAEQIKGNSNVKPQDGISINIPKKYWEITLAWSKYEQGKWMPKQISKQPLVDSIPKPLPDLRKLFRLKALQDNQNNLELHLLFNEYTPHQSDPALGSISEKKILFSFYFDEYSGIKPSSKEGKLKFDLDQKSDFYFMSYENKSGLSIDIPNSILSEKVKTISMKFLDHRFSSTILPLNQYYRSPLISPYFYQDNQHIYFVRSRENYEAIVKQVANPQKTSPFLEKELELQFQGRLPLPKVDGRLEKSVANPWVLAEQQLVAQKLTTFATRSGSTFSP